MIIGKPWFCDYCSEAILQPNQGWVEWVDFDRKVPGRSLRLVHIDGVGADRSTCRDRTLILNGDTRTGYPAGRDLSDLLGPDGLLYLLQLLIDERLPKKEICELIKRLHVPGYEMARRHIRDAVEAGVADSRPVVGFPTYAMICDVLQWASSTKAF